MMSRADQKRDNSPVKVTVVIPNWNTRQWLAGCLNGLRAQTYQDFLVILVDNGSTDDSLDFVKQNYPEIKILTFAENRGFAAAVNAGIRASCSDYIALLNVDTEPQPAWLAELVKMMDSSPPDIGCLASKMLSLSNPEVVDDAGNILSWYGSAQKRGNGEPAKNYRRVEEVFSVSGGASLYRRRFFEEVGRFDEDFGSYLEDVDLGLRGRLLGYRCLYVPTAEVLHQWSGAGIPRARYVFLSTRNRLALLLKNIPCSLLLKHSPTLLYGQFYYFLVYKKPFVSIAGAASFLLALPQTWRKRRFIQQHKRITNDILEKLLAPDLGEPQLRTLIQAKLESILFKKR